MYIYIYTNIEELPTQRFYIPVNSNPEILHSSPEISPAKKERPTCLLIKTSGARKGQSIPKHFKPKYDDQGIARVNTLSTLY